MCLRVLVVCDHALVRAALRALLQQAPAVMASIDGRDDGGASPDAVLLWAEALDSTGLERIRHLAARHAGAPVLVLTSSEGDGALRAALDAGASGFLLASAAPGDLMDAIQTVTRGGLYVRHDLLRSWLRSEPSPTGALRRNRADLTSREIQVLRLVSAGHTTPTIAERLCISVRTVEFHRRNIREKLDATTRADLVHFAIDHGLLGADHAQTGHS